MDYKIEPSRRKVIPNWRYYNNTLNLGELASYKSPVLKVDDVYPIDDYIEDWIDSKSVYRASDLISAAITNSQKGNPHVIEAAKYLISKGSQINTVQQKAAQFILSEGSNAVHNKSIQRLKNEALEKLLNAEDFRRRIHSLRILAHAYPFNPIIYIDMARAYVSIGQTEKAEKLIRMALYLDPCNRFVARSAARFFIHREDDERAADIIRKTGYSRFDPWLMAADISIAMLRGKSSGNIKQGLQMVASSVYSSFSVTELSSSLATVEMEHGTRKKSRDLFNRSLIAPNDNSLAQAEWAVITARMPLTINQNLKVKCNHESQVYKSLEQNDLDSAIKHSIDWICDMPFSMKPILTAYDISTSLLCDYNLSANILTVGLKSHPNDPWMLNNRAYVNARANKIEDADIDIKNLEHYTGYLSESMSICIEATRGLLAYRKKDLQLGRQFYEQAIKHAKELKGNSAVVVVKAKINMLREEIIYSNYQNDSAIKEIESLTIPEHREDLERLRQEVITDVLRHRATETKLTI